MNTSILELIARVSGWFEPLPGSGPGHPPTETVRVLATLRRFLREGTPWRGLRATELAHAIDRLARGHLATRLSELLPWNCKDALAAKTA